MTFNIYWGYSMKIDMSREAVTKRLKTVDQLRKVCLSLASSSAGKSIRKTIPADETDQRTSLALVANPIISAPKNS
jgi:hypothetical protein